MNDERSAEEKAPPGRPWFAGVVFLAMVIAAPLFEFSQGVYPGSRLEKRPPAREIVKGQTAREIDDAFAGDSVVIKKLRPSYLELLYRTTKTHNKKVLVGRDDWLFLSGSVKTIPERYPTEQFARLASLYRQVSEILAEQGTKLIVAIIPSKATVHPEKLPRAYSHHRSHYARINADLRRAGVEAPDLRPVYTVTGQTLYYPNDTHHNPEGALRLTKALRDAMVAMKGEVPGPPARVRIVEIEKIHRGDLQRILGFDEGSDMDKRFDAEVTVQIPYDLATKKPLKAPLWAPVILVGTSYSHGSILHGQLAYLCGKTIADRSRPRVASSIALVELLEELDAGKGPAPEFVLFELPERYLFHSLGEYDDRIRRYVERRGRAVRFKETPVERIGREKMEILGVELSAVPGKEHSFYGVPEKDDPILHISFDPPVVADGSTALSYTITSPSRTSTQIWWDTGKGWSRDLSKRYPLTGEKSAQSFLHVFEGGGAIRRIRIDPVNSSDPFTIADLHLRRRR